MNDYSNSVEQIHLTDEDSRRITFGLLDKCADASEFEDFLKELVRLIALSKLNELPPLGRQLLCSAFDDISWYELSMAVKSAHKAHLSVGHELSADAA